jgi:putative endonuclease
MKDWYVYIVRCSDGTLYTGVAKNVEKRIAEHNSNDLLSAKYTKSRRPVTLVYQELADTRSEAMQRELQIKKLTRKQKEALIKGYYQSNV